MDNPSRLREEANTNGHAGVEELANTPTGPASLGYRHTRDETAWNLAWRSLKARLPYDDALRLMQRLHSLMAQPQADPFSWEVCQEKLDRVYGHAKGGPKGHRRGPTRREQAEHARLPFNAHPVSFSLPYSRAGDPDRLRRLWDAGVAAIPVALGAKGSKGHLPKWKHLQTQRPALRDWHKWRTPRFQEGNTALLFGHTAAGMVRLYDIEVEHGEEFDAHPNRDYFLEHTPVIVSHKSAHIVIASSETVGSSGSTDENGVGDHRLEFRGLGNYTLAPGSIHPASTPERPVVYEQFNPLCDTILMVENVPAFAHHHFPGLFRSDRVGVRAGHGGGSSFPYPNTGAGAGVSSSGGGARNGGEPTGEPSRTEGGLPPAKEMVAEVVSEFRRGGQRRLEEERNALFYQSRAEAPWLRDRRRAMLPDGRSLRPLQSVTVSGGNHTRAQLENPDLCPSRSEGTYLRFLARETLGVYPNKDELASWVDQSVRSPLTNLVTSLQQCGWDAGMNCPTHGERWRTHYTCKSTLHRNCPTRGAAKARRTPRGTFANLDPESGESYAESEVQWRFTLRMNEFGIEQGSIENEQQAWRAMVARIASRKGFKGRVLFSGIAFGNLSRRENASVAVGRIMLHESHRGHAEELVAALNGPKSLIRPTDYEVARMWTEEELIVQAMEDASWTFLGVEDPDDPGVFNAYFWATRNMHMYTPLGAFRKAMTSDTVKEEPPRCDVEGCNQCLRVVPYPPSEDSSAPPQRATTPHGHHYSKPPPAGASRMV